ncbi:hypothetical protein Taro_029314 [Colocasia esculenta]|uniref:Strictosidine synthase conserved region domain-containing protein n=1 Tax=Colocasia esculenta TaxID=4460 RepID=A0A843VZW6_COLES|nr:hypothetical protein [Colocasia esculenta]
MGAAPQQRPSLVAIFAFLFISLASAAFPPSFRVTSAGDLRKCGDMLLPSPAAGPESVAFDGAGGGPYTGASDGRVLRWRPETRLWEDFAVPPRPQQRWAWCNGSHSSLQESVCGRPLGLQFHRATGNLYIADAYFGLLVAGPAGGVAAQVATAADGEPFRFTNGIDIDQENGVVYFTDSSTLFQRR